MMEEKTESLDSYLEVAMSLAKDAGKLIKRSFGEKRLLKTKSNSADTLTETDGKCEALILEGLAKHFPTHKVIAEESHTGSFDISDSPTWFVDPIDGTNNFVHSFPLTCVSIGLMVDRKVVVGVVHNPIMDETFHAVVGKGAFLNGEKIQVSAIADVTGALVSTELGYDRTPDGIDLVLGNIRKLLEAKLQSFRSLGSCALNMCGVACGRIDVFYEGRDSTWGPKPWDLVASALIVTEAGGQVCDWRGGGTLDWTQGRILASNGKLKEQMVKLLNE
eukprot:97074_1